jgi:hypothetical protein
VISVKEAREGPVKHNKGRWAVPCLKYIRALA